MKILFFVPFTRLFKKNAEAVHVRELAENLARLGHDVTVVSSKGPRIEIEGVKQEYVSSIGSGLLRFKSISFFGFFKGLSLLRHEKFDVVYERHFPVAWGAILGRLTGTHCVSEVNGLWTDEARLSKSAFKRLLSKFAFAEFFFSGKADKLVAVTPKIASELEQSWHIPREKIAVVENGVNTELFKPHKSGGKNVCFIGSLAPWQGVEYLVDAAPLVLAKHPGARFVIVGDGPLKKELEASVESKGIAASFEFKGSLDYERVPAVINDSAVCVALKKPLKSGYSPLKLYEYLACGKPVVASKVNGFELIEKNKFGFLVNPEKPSEVANAINKLLSGEALASEMGARGREFVVSGHSWRSVAQKVSNVLKTL